MRLVESRTGRNISRALLIAMMNLAIPASFWASVPRRAEVIVANAAEAVEAVEPVEEGVVIESRPLLLAEMEQLKGRLGRNPYIAGSQKWGVNYNGIDLLTGNFSIAATDLSFEGGYGIPVNVTRTYSANDPDEGPFGIGWTLSVDIRNTAGGLLKSKGAPVRSVPNEFREYSPMTVDGNSPSLIPPLIEGVVGTDASGYEEAMQRDVDGIISTPAWDKNLVDTKYEFVEDGGSVYWVPVEMVVRTPEGTTYHYEVKGEYINGLKSYDPYDGQSGDAIPSNVLKIISATDRHGNATLYTYGSGTVEFNKKGGMVEEHPLLSISMPNGQEISFTWGTEGFRDRIVEISDNGSPAREVTYWYDGALLSEVTTPAGRTTVYDYGYADAVASGVPIGGVLLNYIKDPRGLETEIHYMTTDQSPVLPYISTGMPGVFAHRIIHPNGMRTYFAFNNGEYYLDLFIGAFGAHSIMMDVESPSSPPINGTMFHVLVGEVLTVTNGPGELPGDHWQRIYDPYTQDLLEETMYFSSLAGTVLGVDRNLGDTSEHFYVKTQTSYNFQGNPLQRTVEEGEYGVSPPIRSSTTQYAYHGADRFFQQKAVKDPDGNFSYTDYFPTGTGAGKDGQVYRVYDPKHATFSGTGTDWRYEIEPSGGNHTAEFDYDSKGRPTDVWKLQKTSPLTYVHTNTTYSDGVGNWGNAIEVIEDFGQGKLNRTTETLSYDSAGRATEVMDASGRTFATVYNLDGQVQSVTRTDVNPDETLVSYVYGSSGLSNGMVTSVTDELSGVTQDFFYTASGGGKGQVWKVEETRFTGGGDSTVLYTYYATGERETSTYITPNGTTRWGYADYITVGMPDSPSRVFQTMNKLDSSYDFTPEEFHYQYDGMGRLRYAAFAQTPQLTAPSNGRWYIGTAAGQASSRTVSRYEYLPGGQILELEHGWQVWNGVNTEYDTESFGGNRYHNGSGTVYYDDRGLRTKMDWVLPTNSPWGSSRTEVYTYDVLGQLTATNYDDTGPNGSWSYDPAGNRSNTGYSYNNLNMMLTSPSAAYENDILGNRLWRNFGASGVQRYLWDDVGRLRSVCGATKGARYKYRADGMRVLKVADLTIAWQGSDEEEEASGFYDEILSVDKPTTRYYYDGQMAMETDNTTWNGQQHGRTEITRYGIGARGVDYIETEATSTHYAFPIYDGHGNQIATIGRASNDTYVLQNARTYDVWGSVRTGSSSGFPSQRYCANLGHVQDDESDLIYMRARYYEPWTGRFVSEDRALDGRNWYVYADNAPVQKTDPTGNSAFLEWQTLAWSLFFLYRESYGARAFLQEIEEFRVMFLSKAVDDHRYYKKMAEAAFANAMKAPDDLSKQVALQQANLLQKMSDANWADAKLLMSLAVWQIRTMAWLLAVND